MTRSVSDGDGPELPCYGRSTLRQNPEFLAADAIRDESGCMLRYECPFTRPLWHDGGER
jgi:hypothetical protein